MRKARIGSDAFELSQQLKAAAAGAAGEPSWPGNAPSDADLLAQGEAIWDTDREIRNTEMRLRELRHRQRLQIEDGMALMRRVDRATSALYGESGSEKRTFGLRPFDTQRNRLPVPDAPEEVTLSDGEEDGSVHVRWKRIFRARYLTEAWTGVPEEPGSVLAKAQDSTRASCTLEGLQPGMKVWVRVRATASGRSGPWSEPVGRYVNG